MRFSATSLLTLALPLAYTGVAAAASSAETFLAANPDIAVGREALEKGQASLGPNTFGLVNKPADGVVLLQEFDGETHERVLAVALVDDEKAEQYYRENNRDGDAKGKVMKRFDATGAQDNCPRAVDAAEPFVMFRRAARCGQFCSRSFSCTVDARCPSCRYVGGRCRHQLSCQPRNL